jgi:hypothetical protein
MTVYLYFPKEFDLGSGGPMGFLFISLDVFKLQAKCINLIDDEPRAYVVECKSWKDILHLYSAVIVFKVILFAFRMKHQIPNKILTTDKFDCLYNLYVERESQ